MPSCPLALWSWFRLTAQQEGKKRARWLTEGEDAVGEGEDDRGDDGAHQQRDRNAHRRHGEKRPVVGLAEVFRAESVDRSLQPTDDHWHVSQT